MANSTAGPDRPLTQYFVASSLDGYIADEHNNLDWLLQFPDDDTNPYAEFFAGVGAIVMGATTYEWVLAHDPGPWAYGEVPTWVFTHRQLTPIEGARVTFTDGDVAAVHGDLVTAAGGRNIWLVGGGELVGQFLDAELLDELWVSITPVVLGQGAPLLPRRRTNPMRLESATPSRNGTFVHLRYAVT